MALTLTAIGYHIALCTFVPLPREEACATVPAMRREYWLKMLCRRSSVYMSFPRSLPPSLTHSLSPFVPLLPKLAPPPPSLSLSLFVSFFPIPPLSQSLFPTHWDELAVAVLMPIERTCPNIVAFDCRIGFLAGQFLLWESVGISDELSPM